jgi:hypothetical protein
MTERNWTYEKHSTKYPDLFTYTILEPNEDYGKAGDASQHLKRFSVASELDSEENTKLIIKAVNNYDNLLATLKEIKDFCAETGYTPSVKEQIIAGKCFVAITKAEAS